MERLAREGLGSDFSPSPDVKDETLQKVRWQRLNQEAIMKRKMIRAIILFIITFIARKRSVSQSALVQAVLLQETPEESDVEWFNKYT